jgi:iron-sulfur cluster repair protein YtfE (RIC family)
MTEPTAPSTSMSASQQTIARQHEELHGLVRGLPKTHDLAALVERLGELRSQLEAHYAVEEGEQGFYEIVVKRAPRHHTKVQRLFDEHRDLLRRVDVIATRTRALLDGPAAEIHRDVVELVKLLEDHEHRENELLGDAMYRDTGFGE